MLKLTMLFFKHVNKMGNYDIITKEGVLMFEVQGSVPNKAFFHVVACLVHDVTHDRPLCAINLSLICPHWSGFHRELLSNNPCNIT